MAEQRPVFTVGIGGISLGAIIAIIVLILTILLLILKQIDPLTGGLIAALALARLT